MKNFDLEAAKKGAKVCTMDGREVRVLCFDLKYNNYPICAAFIVGDREVVERFCEDGRFDRFGPCKLDLMMADDDYIDNLERGEYGNATREVPVWQGPYRIMTPDQIAAQPFASIADEGYWRKMYAGMAMQGFMSDSAYKREVSNVCSGLENQMRIAAEMAVIAADALINELKKEKE